MYAQSHSPTVTAMTPMGDKERCTNPSSFPRPWWPFPKAALVSAFPLSQQPLKCCSSTSKGSVKILLWLSPDKPLLSIFRDKIRHQSDWFPAHHVRAKRGGQQQPTHPPIPQECACMWEGMSDSQWSFFFILQSTLSPSCWQPKLNLCFWNYFLTSK